MFLHVFLDDCYFLFRWTFDNAHLSVWQLVQGAPICETPGICIVEILRTFE